MEQEAECERGRERRKSRARAKGKEGKNVGGGGTEVIEAPCLSQETEDGDRGSEEPRVCTAIFFPPPIHSPC